MGREQRYDRVSLQAVHANLLGSGQRDDTGDSMSRVARFAIRRPKLVIASWVVLVFALGLIGRGVEDKVLPTELLVPGTEADRWNDMREGHFGEDAAVLLRGPKEEIDRQGPRLRATWRCGPGTRALSPWSAGKERAAAAPEPRARR